MSFEEWMNLRVGCLRRVGALLSAGAVCEPFRCSWGSWTWGCL